MTEHTHTFVIQKIYMKSLSLESPQKHTNLKNVPWNPALELQLSTHSKVIEKDRYEVTLKVSAKAVQEAAEIYTIHADQVGVFTIKGLSKENLHHTLTALCPTILFPYLRELVSTIVQRAGFPPLYLVPVNFEALYQGEQMKEKSMVSPQLH
ncbi:MAG: protein-export chaperone SecB [Gammaproteobacteria bacterium]|nr:protein-export chaperone SecB [Gammaproteobacteria bacterium]